MKHYIIHWSDDREFKEGCSEEYLESRLKQLTDNDCIIHDCKEVVEWQISNEAASIIDVRNLLGINIYVDADDFEERLLFDFDARFLEFHQGEFSGGGMADKFTEGVTSPIPIMDNWYVTAYPHR